MSPPSRPGLAAHTRAGAGRSSGSWAGGAVDAAPVPSGRRFPRLSGSVLDRGAGGTSVTAVVPTYRCGAAPESHRIPSLATSARPGSSRSWRLSTRLDEGGGGGPGLEQLGVPGPDAGDQQAQPVLEAGPGVGAGPGGQGGLEVGQVAAVTDLPQEPGVALGVRLPGRLGLVLHGAADHVVGHR